MSIYIHKSHNVSLLIYHFVCPTKYHRVVLTQPVDLSIKEICLEIAKRYEIHFLEIGTDDDHVHFLIQSITTLTPQRIIQIVKSLTAREIFKQHPEVKNQLWGGEFWSKGYFVSTVGRSNSENAVRLYVKSQGQEKQYTELLKNQQTLFDH
ncbi:MAG: IS200/IS605 family transposase [Candidatus Vogelbacteria bacterium]